MRPDSERFRYFLALGFFKYAAITYPCDLHEHNGASYVVPTSEELEGVNWEVCPGFQGEILHVPTTILPPACIPQELGYGCAAKVTGEYQQLLHAALKARFSF